MLVRDLGDRFQIVHQPDHGELSGQIAQAWQADLGLSATISEALITAAARHDDGWAVWERNPSLDDEGRPQQFVSVQRDTLLSSYRACVDVLMPEDPGAALLVSMHVSGLNRNRYGVMDTPEITPIEELTPAIREFVIGEEQRQRELAGRLGFDEEERWRAYHQLQVYDLFSLFLGLADVDAGAEATIPPPPRSSAPTLELSTVEPWTIRCRPYPFGEGSTELRMRRRLLSKRRWPDLASFRADIIAAPIEEVSIRLTGD